MSAAPGWYAAPGEPGVARYWDGRQWTEGRRSLPPAPGAASGYPGLTGPGYPELPGLPKGTLGVAVETIKGVASSRIGAVVEVCIVLLFCWFVLGLLKPLMWDEGRAGEGEATIQGTVVSQNIHRSDQGSRMCSPEASFEVGGQTYVAALSGSSSDCPSVGSRVTVIYQVADPEDARVAGSRSAQLGFLFFLLLGVMFLVLTVRDLVGALFGHGRLRWLRKQRDTGSEVELVTPSDRPRPPMWNP